MEEAAEQPAVVDYTCISNPESDKQIYVILKNYHGAYWEKVIDGITEAAKKLDEAVYLGGIDNETDISGQIDLMNQAMEQGADGILLAPADSNVHFHLHMLFLHIPGRFQFTGRQLSEGTGKGYSGSTY